MVSTGLVFLEGLASYKVQEESGNNRSVMPLDVLGRTRATLMHSTSVSLAERPGQSFEAAS